MRSQWRFLAKKEGGEPKVLPLRSFIPCTARRGCPAPGGNQSAGEAELTAGDLSREAERNFRGLSGADGDALGFNNGLAVANDFGLQGVAVLALGQSGRHQDAPFGGRRSGRAVNAQASIGGQG